MQNKPVSEIVHISVSKRWAGKDQLVYQTNPAFNMAGHCDWIPAAPLIHTPAAFILLVSLMHKERLGSIKEKILQKCQWTIQLFWIKQTKIHWRSFQRCYSCLRQVLLQIYNGSHPLYQLMMPSSDTQCENNNFTICLFQLFHLFNICFLVLDYSDRNKPSIWNMLSAINYL